MSHKGDIYFYFSEHITSLIVAQMGLYSIYLDFVMVTLLSLLLFVLSLYFLLLYVITYFLLCFSYEISLYQ